MKDAAQELIGRTVGGRFRLSGFLGEGAMASVFRGEQEGEPREVAVKIMHPELLRDAAFAKRFTREAKAAARIVHRNSVRVLAHGADGDLLYLAMELLAGQDLFDVLARERRLPEARAAGIVIQVCGALGAAHAHGVIHRDLKPENVMILPDPDEPGADLVKVLDFGIAKILDIARDEPPPSGPSSGPVSSSPLTLVGGLVGTPEYMSPEQTRGQPVDARSDLYACGVLLYHLVTGRPPFKSDNLIEVLLAHADEPPPPPSTFRPDIHPRLSQIILKALSKRPEARQQTAAELAAELDALLADLATITRPAKLDPSARDTPAPGSGLGRSLPGVPGSVAITAPVRSSAPPPDTLRSPPQASEPVAGAPLPIVYTDDALPYEKTLALEASHDGAPAEPPPAAAFAKTLALDTPLIMELPPAPAAAAFAKTLALDTPLIMELPPAPATAAFAKTLALDTPLIEPVAPVAKQSGGVAIDPAVGKRPLGPPWGSPWQSPPLPPTPVLVPRPAAKAGGRWTAAWWVLLLAVVILGTAIWLLRTLRIRPFG